jgi:hypothetical protein
MDQSIERAAEQPMAYAPLQRWWRRLGPLYRAEEATLLWYLELEAFSRDRAEDHGFAYKPVPLTPELRPVRYDSCDWRFDRACPGPAPAFWDYVVHSACHWTCNLHLWVAAHARPKQPWRIVTSQKHSTVWDGENTLWDGNFLALGVTAEEAWSLAAEQPDSEHLPVGELMLHEPPDEALRLLRKAT